MSLFDTLSENLGNYRTNAVTVAMARLDTTTTLSPPSFGECERAMQRNWLDEDRAIKKAIGVGAALLRTPATPPQHAGPHWAVGLMEANAARLAVIASLSQVTVAKDLGSLRPSPLPWFLSGYPACK